MEVWVPKEEVPSDGEKAPDTHHSWALGITGRKTFHQALQHSQAEAGFPACWSDRDMLLTDQPYSRTDGI